jgi:hypothetical protein
LTNRLQANYDEEICRKIVEFFVDHYDDIWTPPVSLRREVEERVSRCYKIDCNPGVRSFGDRLNPAGGCQETVRRIRHFQYVHIFQNFDGLKFGRRHYKIQPSITAKINS